MLSVAALVSTGGEYDHLASIYLLIAIGVFALIMLVVVVVVIVFRRRPVEQAARWHEHDLIEGTYALVLACTAAFLLYLTFSAEHRTDTVANRQRPAVVVDVTASKWEWMFTYRGYGFSARSGAVGRQPLVVPAGEPVRLNLVSEDVIHSFWIPAVRYKHDAIPGSSQVITLTFGQGTFPGQCAEFCGLRHSDMVFSVRAVSPAAFVAWARSKGRTSLS